MSDYYLKYPDKHKEQAKKYRDNNKEKIAAWSKKSYEKLKNNPENIKKFLLKYAKSRALKKRLDFSLETSDIILPSICPILKKPFIVGSRKYGYSLDRIDPTKGYTSDNVWVVSQIANAMKWDSSYEDRKAFAEWVLSEEGGNLL